MGEATRADSPLLSLLNDGSDEELKAFTQLLTPRELAQMLAQLPEDLRARALGPLDAYDRADVLELMPVAAAADILEDFAPQESADVLEDIDEEHRAELFSAMEIEDQAQVLRALDDEDAREELIDAIPDADLADIAEQQRSDDATDLVDELDEDRRARVLHEMEAEKRAEIEALQKHGPETAGGLMQTELVRLPQGLTVQQAIEIVRSEYTAKMGAVYDMYVVDDEGKLLGRVRNRHLVLNSADTAIGDVMLTDVVAVPLSMDQEEIAELVQEYDVASVAVTDEKDRLVGRILIDDILDVIEEEATEDVARMAGTAADDVYTDSFVTTVKARFPWLLGTFGGGLLMVFLIMSWEEMLISDVPLLAAVIPIIMGMSGNVGTQAATVTVRGIAVGEIEFARIGKVVTKEMATGLIMAGAFSILLFVAVRFLIAPITGVEWPVGPADPSAARVILVPTVAMGLTIAASSAIGTMVPIVLHRLGRDPAVASAPFITTLVDVIGIGLLVAAKLLLLGPGSG